MLLCKETCIVDGFKKVIAQKEIEEGKLFSFINPNSQLPPQEREADRKKRFDKIVKRYFTVLAKGREEVSHNINDLISINKNLRDRITKLEVLQKDSGENDVSKTEERIELEKKARELDIEFSPMIGNKKLKERVNLALNKS